MNKKPLCSQAWNLPVNTPAIFIYVRSKLNKIYPINSFAENLNNSSDRFKHICEATE